MLQKITVTAIASLVLASCGSHEGTSSETQSFVSEESGKVLLGVAKQDGICFATIDKDQKVDLITPNSISHPRARRALRVSKYLTHIGYGTLGATVGYFLLSFTGAPVLIVAATGAIVADGLNAQFQGEGSEGWLVAGERTISVPIEAITGRWLFLPTDLMAERYVRGTRKDQVMESLEYKVPDQRFLKNLRNLRIESAKSTLPSCELSDIEKGQKIAHKVITEPETVEPLVTKESQKIKEPASANGE